MKNYLFPICLCLLFVLPVRAEETGSLRANLDGKLYQGWLIDRSLGYESESIQSLVRTMRKEGSPVWAALQFDGEAVQLHFETASGRREILNGWNRVQGQLDMSSASGANWQFRKRIQGDGIYWLGSPVEGTARSLLIYRPVNRIYTRLESMQNLAPEAFLWISHPWGQEYHEARFWSRWDDYQAFDDKGDYKGKVKSVEQSAAGVSAVTIFLGKEEGTRRLSFDPPRPRSRVPLAEGFPVAAELKDGEIDSLSLELSPLSWREHPVGNLELLMISSIQAEFVWDEQGRPQFPPGRLEQLAKVVVSPDFGMVTHDVGVTWRPKEDKIFWSVADRGAGMLELESLSLDDLPSAAAGRNQPKPPPWRSLSEPIDFATDQLRVVNVNDTSGFEQVLPTSE